jgi:nucleotidyltransferase/DNA polymerase involved in DNA repair
LPFVRACLDFSAAKQFFDRLARSHGVPVGEARLERLQSIDAGRGCLSGGRESVATPNPKQPAGTGIAADPPDGLVMETTGADHRHGGEPPMLAYMVQRFVASGIVARAAIADRWGAAHAFARHLRGTITVIPPGEDAKHLVDLPIAALRLLRSIAEGLQSLGVERIGELATQPRAPLALRFGPELGRRLDQAFGRIAEPIEPSASIWLRSSADSASLFQPPRPLRDTLASSWSRYARLSRPRGLAPSLDLLFHRVDNRIEAVRVGVALPVRDIRRLTRLLCDKIETIDPGFGIEKMVLTATLAEPLKQKQIISSLVEEQGTRRFWADRYPRQSYRRAAALSLCASSERCAGTCDCAGATDVGG